MANVHLTIIGPTRRVQYIRAAYGLRGRGAVLFSMPIDTEIEDMAYALRIVSDVFRAMGHIVWHSDEVASLIAQAQRNDIKQSRKDGTG